MSQLTAPCGLGEPGTPSHWQNLLSVLPCGASRGVQDVAVWRCQPWTAAGRGTVVVLCWSGRADRASGRWAESKAWTSSSCGKRVTHMPKKSVSFFSCTDTWVAVLHWVGSQCSCRWTTVGLLSSTPEQCPVSQFLKWVSAQKHPQIPCSPALISLLFHPYFARKIQRSKPWAEWWALVVPLQPKDKWGGGIRHSVQQHQQVLSNIILLFKRGSKTKTVAFLWN